MTERSPRTPDGRPAAEQPRWRRDFPIDVEEDAYVARRDFAKYLVLVSGAFASGQVWLLVRSLLRRSAPPGPPRLVASVDDVPPGGALSFRYPTEHDPCLLIRRHDGAFVAYGSQCTHLMCAVIPDVAAGQLRCPCHNGSFDLATGQPTAGPPRRRLPRIDLDVRDGGIYATRVRLEAE
ncbi:MAG TPA: Rieske (2Fe-2S) protein [Planctomycetota bacterium]|nr:Rieske (2Fe-2S) protein [Planctomycetota bacterium]